MIDHAVGLAAAPVPDDARDVIAALTAPDGAFALVDGPGGLPVFAKRPASVAELVARAAKRAERDFLVEGDQRLSYGGFARAVWGAARALLDAGLQRRDRVAVLAHSGIDPVVALFGTAVAGGVAVPLNWSWTTDEIAYALADCSASIVVVSDALRARLPAGITAAVVAASDLAARVDNAPPDIEIDEDDLFALVYTSGTTGRPKGCMTTHRGTVAQVQSMVFTSVVEKELRTREGVVAPASPHPPALLATSPLFHVSGLHAGIGSALITGSKVVFPPARFDAATLLRLIQDERITAWGAVPTIIQRVVTAPDLASYDLSSLASVSIGGAPLPPPVLARAQEVFGKRLNLGHGYGLTETTGSVTMNGGKSLAARPGSVGRAGPLLTLRIVDPDGGDVPTGETGEVAIRGVTVTPGYWNDTAATASLVPDGWLRTGDVGRLDADGYLYLADRIKDIVIRGGENIHSLEVEDCLAEHPDVDEVAVIGIPDDDLGERVGAVAFLKPGASATAEDLRAHVARTLASFKVPDRIWIVTEPLPRNAVGKIVKADVKRKVGVGA